MSSRKKVSEPKFLKRYPAFGRLNGNHPYRKAVPEGSVDYYARTRKGGNICYFNFELAREIGLISKRHPNQLNKDLEKALMHTFAIQIINEYDRENGLKVPAKQQRPNPFMATRYLQLQHADKMGLSSGDGRGIWNGYYKGKKKTWDVSSSGTGATCLSPAFSAEKTYIKTGDKVIAYGNGLADIIDGVGSAVMSEIFHQNRIRTERILALIEYPDGSSINVRCYPNLIRPAHLFLYLKQGDHDALQRALDYYLEREILNGDYPCKKSKSQMYDLFLRTVCRDFAKTAAKFENEYIFCWMDWDGDNILMNGAIIDYGSVRQFGLFHHEYRYDDVEQMSTTIKEQKKKAKYTVQTFAQMVDFVKTGNKRRIQEYAAHPILTEFDKQFEKSRISGTLYKMGFEEKEIKKILNRAGSAKLAAEFQSVYSYFEMASARRGFYKVSDGITRDAIFCMRDLMREIPKIYLNGCECVDAKTFIQILRSQYASSRDVRLTKVRIEQIALFQKKYWQLVKAAAKQRKCTPNSILKQMCARSEVINRYERVTGDGILYVTKKLLALRKKVTHDVFYQVIRNFVVKHIQRPEAIKKQQQKEDLSNKNVLKVFRSMIRVVRESREGL